MPYWLGIDLGTTYTAAAVWRDGDVEVVPLGERGPMVPSVVYIGGAHNGTVLVGEPADARAVTEPHRVVREFKRRIGDSAPIVVGGTPYSADALTAHVLAWVARRATEIHGGPPDGLVVAHPANWQAYKLDLLDQAVRRAGLGAATPVAEPVAAAVNYAHQQRVRPDAAVAVYDLGGGTFDTAILRRRGDGWEILGEPQGIERLGGIDFDHAVVQHVRNALGERAAELDRREDPDAAAIAARFRQECATAKEMLSADTEAAIAVVPLEGQTTVRLTRTEFEEMARPLLEPSVRELRHAVDASGVQPDDLDAVLLVGGSSRIPLVAQMVGAALRRPVAIDAHPKLGVAMGAAIVGARLRREAAAEGVAAAPTVLRVPHAEPVQALGRPPAVEPAPVERPDRADRSVRSVRRRATAAWLLLAASTLAASLASVGFVRRIQLLNRLPTDPAYVENEFMSAQYASDLAAVEDQALLPDVWLIETSPFVAIAVGLWWHRHQRNRRLVSARRLPAGRRGLVVAWVATFCLGLIVHIVGWVLVPFDHMSYKDEPDLGDRLAEATRADAVLAAGCGILAVAGICAVLTIRSLTELQVGDLQGLQSGVSSRSGRLRRGV